MAVQTEIVRKFNEDKDAIVLFVEGNKLAV